MKHALGVASLILVAATAIGCGGGGDDAPTNASKGDFCDQYAKAQDVKDGKDIKEWADELEDIGTPKDMSDDEREGFEIFIDAVDDIDEDAKPEDIEDPDLSKDDEKKAEKFIEYTTKTCADAS